MGDTWRTFLAVEFSREIQQEIGRTVRDLAECPVRVKWVKPVHFHLTLKFLGATPVEKKQPILDALKNVAAEYPPFVVSLQGIGGFPTLDRASTLWVGVAEGAREMTALAAGLEAALELFGFPVEARSFFPHATIGRVKAPGQAKILQDRLAPYLERNFGHCPVEMIAWFKSTLTCEGPVHEVLERIPFKNI